MLMPVWLSSGRPLRRVARFRLWPTALVSAIVVSHGSCPRIGIHRVLGRQPVAGLPAAWPVLSGYRGVRVFYAAIMTVSGSIPRTRARHANMAGAIAMRSAGSRLIWPAFSAPAARRGRSRRRSGPRSRTFTGRGAFIATGGSAEDRVERADRILDNCCDCITGAR